MQPSYDSWDEPDAPPDPMSLGLVDIGKGKGKGDFWDKGFDSGPGDSESNGFEYGGDSLWQSDFFDKGLGGKGHPHAELAAFPKTGFGKGDHSFHPDVSFDAPIESFDLDPGKGGKGDFDFGKHDYLSDSFLAKPEIQSSIGCKAGGFPEPLDGNKGKFGGNKGDPGFDLGKGLKDGYRPPVPLLAKGGKGVPIVPRPGQRTIVIGGKGRPEVRPPVRAPFRPPRPRLAGVPPPPSGPLPLALTTALTLAKLPGATNLTPPGHGTAVGLAPELAALAEAEEPSAGEVVKAEKKHRLFMLVTKLAHEVEESHMQQILEQCGEVQAWRRGRGVNSEPLSFGFVQFGDPEAAWKASVCLSNKISICGREIKILVEEQAHLVNRLDECSHPVTAHMSCTERTARHTTNEQHPHLVTGQHCSHPVGFSLFLLS